MRNFVRTACVVGVLGAMASPALAFGPETGDQHRSQHQLSGTPQYNGSENPGTEHRQSGPLGRALGVVCTRQGASKSNEGDPEPGTPFSRCVKSLAQATKTACKGEPKQRPEGDTEHGTPFSRCVKDLAKGLRANKAKSDRRQAKIACRRPDFESGKEFGRCVRTLAKALRKV
jgi:hypothetical protein